MNDNDDSSSSALPQVLTHSVIPSLTQGLDASDVLECYALVRAAPLHGVANSTIAVQKMAIGVRYRPTGAAALLAKQQRIEKKPLELTLEFGPQRFGSFLHHEAIPYVQVAERESSFMAWDNAGRVFYTNKIINENYISSYFMASVTGAVLDKILVQAVEYTERRRHYQPFSVYSTENGREVRSSSSADFVQYLWNHMAKMGVEIEPILPPPVYEVRLWVDSLEKVAPEPQIANQAANFYQKLYNCLEAIAVNDYSEFNPTLQPTVSSEPTLQVQSALPSSEPSMLVAGRGESSFEPVQPSPADPSADFDNGNKPNSEEIADKDTNDEDEDTEDTNGGQRQRIRNRRILEGDDLQVDTLPAAEDEEDLNTDDFIRDEDDLEEGEEPLDVDEEVMSNSPSELSSISPTDTSSPSLSPTITPMPTTLAPTDEEAFPGQDVEKAKQAAEEAKQKAEEAKNAAQTEGETIAADAAQAAADAAQVAAEATSNAAAQADMDNLLSGDGDLMSSIVTMCLTDPKYQIATSDGNGTIITSAFLYRDGSTYYKLNMTSPYVQVVKSSRGLPPPYDPTEFGSGGDFVDWALALLVLSSIFLLFLVLMQQMGHEFVSPLYRWQRWFFNPRKYDYEGNKLDDEDNNFQFGEDGIPLSMGGRLSNVSPIAHRVVRESTPTAGDTSGLSFPSLRPTNGTSPALRTQSSNGSANRELELSSLSNGRLRTRAMSSGNESHGSLSDQELDLDGPVVPDRLKRDPELVDMPNLRSRTRVAIPVGATPTGRSTPTEQSFDTGMAD